MDNQSVEVVENNEHLGQIVSGSRQEEKNVDQMISDATHAMFSLLVQSFSCSC